MSYIKDFQQSAQFNHLNGTPQFTQSQIRSLNITKRYDNFNWFFANEKTEDFGITKFIEAVTFFFTAKIK